MRVGKVSPIPAATPRPTFVSPKVGKATSLGAFQSTGARDVRLIYYDQARATELVEQMAAVEYGREKLSSIESSINQAEIISQQNPRLLLSRLIASIHPFDIVDLETGDAMDPHALQIHPAQPIAVRGTVESTKDVQLSSLLLNISDMPFRACVNRDHFLHLNQAYLVGFPMTIIGIVRSVARADMQVAAIARDR